MKKAMGVLAVMVAMTLVLAAYAQRGGHPQPPRQRGGEDHGVGNGHIPAHGPAPVRTPSRSAEPKGAGMRALRRRTPGAASAISPIILKAPHVHAEND